MDEFCKCKHKYLIHYPSDHGDMCGACNCGWKSPTVVTRPSVREDPEMMLTSAKLSLHDIYEIRELWATGECLVRDLASTAGVGTTVIYNVIHGKYGDGAP